jgi:hypothetical protein
MALPYLSKSLLSGYSKQEGCPETEDLQELVMMRYDLIGGQNAAIGQQLEVSYSAVFKFGKEKYLQGKIFGYIVCTLLEKTAFDT